jgi:hypothetical protein
MDFEAVSPTSPRSASPFENRSISDILASMLR